MLMDGLLTLLEPSNNPQATNIKFALAMQKQRVSVPTRHKPRGDNVVRLGYSGKKAKYPIKKTTGDLLEEAAFAPGLNSIDNITGFAIHLPCEAR